MRLGPRGMGGRLALSLSAGLLVLWIASAVSAAVVVSRELSEMFDSILMESAQVLLPDLSEHYGAQLAAPPAGGATVVTRAIPHDEYLTWRLYASDGRLLMRSHGASEDPMPPAGFATIADARYYTERTPDGRWFLTIAEPPGHRRHAIAPTLLRLLAPLFLLVLATLLLIPLLVRRGFAPVHALRAEISRRGGSNLAPLDAPHLPDELGSIRDGVDLLLRRLRQALEAERSFSANAAHELRTPVASALAQAQLLAARLPPGSAERSEAEEMAAGMARLGARVEKLLQLARAEAGVALRREPVDLLVPLSLLAEEFADQQGVGDRLRFDDGGLDRLMVAADLDALAIALRNLIENALRHGPPGGTVSVSAHADGRVSVVNDGPVLPPERLAALPRRFVSHGGKGSGLGLSIVQAIAEQIGGTLSLHSPAVGREDGFEAVLSLPLAPEAATARA